MAVAGAAAPSSYSGRLESQVRELVTRASSGDPEAVGDLLVHYLPRLEAYVRMRAGRVLLDRESAADLAQSVCREALAGIDRYSYHGEDQFRGWLYTIAARKIADRYAYWGAAKRREPLGGGAEAVAGESEATPLEDYLSLCTPSRDAMAREELRAVQLELDRLPPQSREAILLSRVLGLKRREVAEVLGVTENDVRVMIYRGLASVASAVQGRDERP